jgi:hypothetical protein
MGHVKAGARPLGKLADDIAYVRDRIVCAYKPEKIILFGSAASSDARGDSDLGLLISEEALLRTPPRGDQSHSLLALHGYHRADSRGARTGHP